MIDSQLVDYYARRLPEYDAIYRMPERQDDLALLRSRVSALLDGHDVLELACGTGYWTAVLAEVANSVVATDAGTPQLECAAARRLPTGRVRFRQADAFTLGPMDDVFTAGFAGFWWSHIRKSDLRPFLRQFHRRLCVGARVVFIDNKQVVGSSTPVTSLDSEGNTLQRRTLADGTTHNVLKNFPTAAELTAAVEGMADQVDVTGLKYYWCLSYTVRS